MANTLKFKRGLLAGLPTAAEGEPLFTTDTADLYIGTSTGNQRFQKYIASGTTSQLLRGDGSLLTMPIVLTSPANGQVLKYNGTNWVNDSDSGITGSGSAGQVTYWGSSSTITGSNNLFWDATNNRLGIGTNTPAQRFDLVGGNMLATWNQNGETSLTVTNTTNDVNASVVLKAVVGTGGNHEMQIGKFGLTKTAFKIINSSDGYIFNNSADIAILNNAATGAIKFAAGGSSTSQLTLNSLGNLGLGISPSSWDTSFRALLIKNASISNFNTNTTLAIQNNGYFSTDWRYVSSAAAAMYVQGTSGQHQWYTAASGTAGNVITFSNPMTLTANGRLLLGTTTEGTQRLQVAGDVKFDADAASNGFYWDNTNKRLGIGTTSPTFKLHLADGGAFMYSGLRLGAGYSAIDVATGVSGLYLSGAQGALNHVFINPNGSVGIGSTSLTGVNFRVSKTLTGATTAYTAFFDSQIQSDVTSNAFIIRSNPSTQAAAFTLATLYHFSAFQGTIGASSAVTNQFGFFVDTSLTGATNNYGFYGNIASGTGRWNLYMNGTAANYLNGNTLIGSTTDSGEKLQVTGTMKVTGASTLTGNITSNGLLYIDGAATAIRTNNTVSYTSLESRLSGTRSWQIDNVSNAFQLYMQGASAYVFNIASTGAATFSSSVTAASLVVDTNTLVVDATNDRVGIGTTTPSYKAHIVNNASSPLYLAVQNTTAGSTSSAIVKVISDTSSGSGELQKKSSTGNTYKVMTSNDLVLYNDTAGDIDIFNDHTNGKISLTAGGSSSTHLTLDTSGRLGFANNSPTAYADLAASTSTTASLRIRSGSAPTTPNDGDIWFDGTDIKMRIGGVTKTFTLT